MICGTCKHRYFCKETLRLYGLPNMRFSECKEYEPIKRGYIEAKFIGKTVTKAEVDGYGITLFFSDGTRFIYDASDGGYSTYIWEGEEE